MEKIKKNIFLLLIIQAVNYIFPLLTFPYLTRTLGVESFGLFAFSQSIIIYITSFVDFGFNLTSTRKISKAFNENNFEKINEIYWYTTLAKILLVIISALIFYVSSCFFQQLKLISFLVTIGYISIISSVFIPYWLFQGIQSMKPIVYSNIVGKVINLLLVFYLVKTSYDTNAAMFAYSCGIFISSLYLVFFLKKLRLIYKIRINLNTIYSYLFESFPIFLTFIGASIYTTLNTFFMSFYVSIAAVGIYSGAERIRSVAQSMISPLQQAIYPHLSAKKDGEYFEELKKYGVLLFLFSILISILLYIFSDKIVYYLLGSKFHESSLILKILSILPMIISLAIIFGQWGLVNMNRSKVLSKIYLAAAFIHVFYMCLLCYFYNIYGAAISVVITETIVSGLIMLFFIKSVFYEK